MQKRGIEIRSGLFCQQQWNIGGVKIMTDIGTSDSAFPIHAMV